MMCFSMGCVVKERWVNDVFLYGLLSCEERWVMMCFSMVCV